MIRSQEDYVLVCSDWTNIRIRSQKSESCVDILLKLVHVALVNLLMYSESSYVLQEGLARLERRKRWDTKERQSALDNLEEHQAKAKRERLKMWQYGDIQSDDEDSAPPVRKAAGRR